MRHVNDKTFTNEVVQLDDTIFENCTFDGCRLVYEGGEFGFKPVINFEGPCSFSFKGPARGTVHLLRYIYTGGERGKQTVTQILSAPPDMAGPFAEA